MPETPRTYHSALSPHIRRAVELPKVEAVVRRAVHARSNYDDSHPTLGDRLANLGVEGHLPAPVETPSSVLLGDLHATALAKFDDEWFEANKEYWPQMHQSACAAVEKFNSLNAQTTNEAGGLPHDDVLILAGLAMKLSRKDRALEIFEDGSAWFPESARMRYVLADCLLDNGDARGWQLLDDTMSLDETSVGAACEQAMIFSMSVISGNKQKTTVIVQRSGTRRPRKCWKTTVCRSQRTVSKPRVLMTRTTLVTHSWM